MPVAVRAMCLMFEGTFGVWECMSKCVKQMSKFAKTSISTIKMVKGMLISHASSGEGGSDICDTVYEGLSETGNLVRQSVRGSENLQISVTSFMNDPKGHQFITNLNSDVYHIKFGWQHLKIIERLILQSALLVLLVIPLPTSIN